MHKKATILALFLIVLFLSSCAPMKKPPLIPKSVNATNETKNKLYSSKDLEKSLNSNQTLSQYSVETLSVPSFEPKIKKPPLPPVEPIDAAALVHTKKPVLINVESMPLSDFIIYGIGDVLKVTFFIDEAVKNMKNPVTIRMTSPMEPAQALEMIINFLKKYDLKVEQKAGALYITKNPTIPGPPMAINVGEDVAQSPATVLQIVPLKYVNVNNIQGILQSTFKSNGVTINTYYQANAFFLSGPAYAVRDVVNFIEMLDVPYLAHKKVSMIKLTYWDPGDFIKQMSNILSGLGFPVATKPNEIGVYFIPINVLNSVLVITPDEKSMNYVLEWYKKLDTPEAAGTEEKAYIYEPKYSKASELVEAIENLYNPQSSRYQKTESIPTQSANPQNPTATPSPTPIKQAQSTTTQKTQASFETPKFKIAADNRRNIVLIQASPMQYKTLLTYLTNLDVPPREVLLEATIAQVTLTGNLKYGLEWYLQNQMSVGGNTGTYNLSTLGNLGVANNGGLVYSFVANNNKIKLLFSALASKNLINVLSAPRLMVIDNHEATIQVGANVPIISGETSSTAATTQTVITTQSVQYQQTGLILKVKPNINTNGLLTLDLSLELSNAQQNTLSNVSSPIISMQKIDTQIVASSDQTIILGGLMQTENDETKNGIPFLSDIPLLGTLFSNTSKTKTNTELIILIKPIIITKTEEASKITDEIRKGITWLSNEDLWKQKK
jgi:general secretion pathway protein D